MSLTLYDVAHYVSWNGYTEDMKRYVEVDKQAWNNDEFWFPYMINLTYGKHKKTRIQIICEHARAFYYDETFAKECGWLFPALHLMRIKELLARKAKPDVKDAEGFTPLSICCRAGGAQRIPIIEALLDAGADVNQQTDCITTPIHFAAYNGYTDIVNLLIKRGANIVIADRFGIAPIHSAAQNGHEEVVKILLKHGESIDVIDDSGHNCITMALLRNKPKMILFLHSLGCPILPGSIELCIEHNLENLIPMLVKLGASCNERTIDGYSMFEVVLIHKNWKAADYLCKYGIDMNAPMHETHPLSTTTLLDYAICMGEFKLFKILCDNNIDLNYSHPVLTEGETALMTIIHINIYENNKSSMMKYIDEVLSHNNIDLEKRSEDGNEETALEMAERRGALDIVCQLQRYKLKQKFTKKRLRHSRARN